METLPGYDLWKTTPDRPFRPPCRDGSIDELVDITQGKWDDVLADAIDLSVVTGQTGRATIELTASDSSASTGEILSAVSLDFVEIPGADPSQLADRLELLAELIRLAIRGGPNLPGRAPDVNPHDSH